MDESAACADDLASLTRVLATPGADLEAELTALSDRMQLAVPSYLGLRMTVTVEGLPVTLAAVDARVAVAASLLVHLPTRGGVGPGSVVVFYAGMPGAFVDLAADVGFVLGDGSSGVVLDEQLRTSPEVSGLHGLDDLSAVNRAIGVLIGQGRTPDAADAELGRRAREVGVTRAAAARDVLRRPPGRS